MMGSLSGRWRLLQEHPAGSANDRLRLAEQGATVVVTIELARSRRVMS